jgi:hypothetical protein
MKLEFSSEFTSNTKRIADVIDSEFEMVRVPIVPYRDSKPAFCYQNVERKVKAMGGTLQFGWVVVESTFSVEATHHAVWEDKMGNLIDVTPHQLPINNVLFIPDNRIKYDGKLIDSIRLNITDNKVVEDFILSDRIKNIIIAQSPQINDGQRMVMHHAWPKYTEFGNNIIAFLQKGNSHISPCYCNSGNTYQECHGSAFQKSWEADKTHITDVVVRLESLT